MLRPLHVLLILLAFGIFAGQAQAQDKAPSWIKYQHRNAKYPDSRYLKGYSAAELTRSDAREDLMGRLKGAARSKLAESVVVEIKSMTTTQIINENSSTYDLFRRTSVSMTNVRISGLSEEEYFDEKEETGYVFTYALRTDVNESYKSKLSEMLGKTADLLEKAKEYQQNGNEKKAMQTINAAQSRMQEVYQAQGVLMALNKVGYGSSILKTEEVSTLKDEISSISDALQANVSDLGGLSYLLAGQLVEQATELEKPFYLAGITFEDTRINSQFSKRLISQLRNDLTQQGIRVITTTGAFQGPDKAHYYLLDGNYWDESEKLSVTLNVKNFDTGEVLASSTGKIAVEDLKTKQISYKPQNYNQVIQDLQALNSNEFVGSGLNVEVSTNKGSRNPIFAAGDTMRLYVKVNRPCYLRFIYYLADGSKVLMMDNNYIDQAKVNKVVELPGEFEIVEPFGAEILQVNAQTEAFKPLNTKPYYHYKLIMDNTEQIVENVRGFKPVNDKGGHDETRLTLTTLPY